MNLSRAFWASKMGERITDCLSGYSKKLSRRAIDFSFQLHQFSKERDSAVDDAYRAFFTLLKGDTVALEVSQADLGKGLHQFRIGLGVSLEELRSATSDNYALAARCIEESIPYSIIEGGNYLDHLEYITTALIAIGRRKRRANE